MKKVLIGAAVLAGIVLLLRRLGPALGRRAMEKCEEMVDRMPDAFPPKRMMRSIAEIRDQNSRILGLLEREPAALAAAPGRR